MNRRLIGQLRATPDVASQVLGTAAGRRAGIAL